MDDGVNLTRVRLCTAQACGKEQSCTGEAATSPSGDISAPRKIVLSMHRVHKYWQEGKRTEIGVQQQAHLCLVVQVSILISQQVPQHAHIAACYCFEERVRCPHLCHIKRVE